MNSWNKEEWLLYWQPAALIPPCSSSLTWQEEQDKDTLLSSSVRISSFRWFSWFPPAPPTLDPSSSLPPPFTRWLLMVSRVWSWTWRRDWKINSLFWSSELWLGHWKKTEMNLCSVVEMVQFGLDAVDGFLHVRLSGISRDSGPVQTRPTENREKKMFEGWGLII